MAFQGGYMPSLAWILNKLGSSIAGKNPTHVQICSLLMSLDNLYTYNLLLDMVSHKMIFGYIEAWFLRTLPEKLY